MRGGVPGQADVVSSDQIGVYAVWPGLAYQLANKHFPQLAEERKGHRHKVVPGVQLTTWVAKSRKVRDKKEENSLGRKRIQGVYARVMDVEEEVSDLVYTDQPGAFPVISSRGNRCIMGLLDYNSNFSFSKPMANQTTDKVLRAPKHLNNKLKMQR